MKLNLFRKTFLTSMFVLLGAILFMSSAFAAEGDSKQFAEDYFRARVLSIQTASTEAGAAMLQTQIISGPEKGKKIDARYEFGVAGKLDVGDKVVVAKASGEGQEDFYYVIDPYRIGRLWILAVIFIIVALFFGKRKGMYAIVGLAISVLTIFYYLVPKIIKGGSPLWASFVAALVIAVVSLYVAHGFSRRTTIAFTGTIISLGLAVLIDLIFVSVAKLTGAGSEEALYLQFGTGKVDLQGILLAGILIGVLGVLDDATTAQAASLEEIHRANPRLSFSELYRRGLSIGREHIASCINTLVLAYVGVSFPMILLLISNKGSLWVVLNSGFMAEEIVRALVGSMVLVIAVPLTTFLAAYYYSKWPVKGGVPLEEEAQATHTHTHTRR